jgi:Domain of unknown function (DUF397)
MPARQSRPSTLNWRKSQASNSTAAQCVEIASTGRAVMVRDSTDRASALLAFAPGQWSAFLDRLLGES